jgi:hypothetical protein
MKYTAKITNLSFEIELTEIPNSQNPAPIEQPEPVIPTPPIDQPEPVNPTPPIEVGVENITQDWMDHLLDDRVREFHIPEGVFKVNVIQSLPVARQLKIVSPANRSTVLFGQENYIQASNGQQGNLIFLKHGAKVLIDNVNLCIPKQLKAIDPFRPAIFQSQPGVDVDWVAAVRNCDTTVLGRHGGMGFGYLYGSNNGNHIAAVNFKHMGGKFLDAKTSVGSSKDTILGVTLFNVETDNADESELGMYRVFAKAMVKNNVYTILDGASVSNLANPLYNRTSRAAQGNYAHIIHIGRFTFMLDPDQTLDEKNIRLRPNANGQTFIRVIGGKVYTIGKESHAGDTFLLNGRSYTVIEKGRDDHPFWCNNYKPDEVDTAYTPYARPSEAIPDGEYVADWKSSFNLEGETCPTWMIYKESKYGFHTTAATQFQDAAIMAGEATGHDMYNHASITLWARNVIQRGYYRQTNPGGKSLGYNMVNCQGFKDQFNPPVPVTSDPNKPMPQPILDLLNY